LRPAVPEEHFHQGSLCRGRASGRSIREPFMSDRSNRIAFCALAATAAFALASPAQAGFIGTKFDPTFFDGTGTFFLPDVPGCLGLGDGFHTVNGGSDPCTGVVLVNASVNVSDGGGTAHLALPPPTPGPTDVTGIVIDTTTPQLVVGVNTILIPIIADSCSGDLCFYEWWIEWDSGLPAGTVFANDIPGLSNSVTLFRQFCPDGCTGDREQFGDPAVNVTFFPAPEPGSLALLAGALGAGWWVRRRRTAL
jgi:hypothetical protein